MKNFEAPFLKKNLDNPKVGQKGYQTTKDLAYQRFSLRGFFYCCESKIINYEKSQGLFLSEIWGAQRKSFRWKIQTTCIDQQFLKTAQICPKSGVRWF